MSNRLRLIDCTKKTYDHMVPSVWGEPDKRLDPYTVSNFFLFSYQRAKLTKHSLVDHVDAVESSLSHVLSYLVVIEYI